MVRFYIWCYSLDKYVCLCWLYFCLCSVKVGRSGSRPRVQTGGRRPGRAHLRQRSWRTLPAPQLVAGDQRKRNPRKGVRDPQGAAGRCKEGVVSYLILTHLGIQKIAWKKKQLTVQMLFPVKCGLDVFSCTSQELKLKDKECERLSQVRNQLEQELEELTASLFEVSSNHCSLLNVLSFWQLMIIEVRWSPKIHSLHLPQIFYCVF